MPKRRAQDVVRAVVTDHFVQRPSSLDWTGQLRETFPAVRSVQIVGEAQLSEIEQQIYSTVASIRLLPEAEQVIRLHGLLGTFPMDQPEPYHDLALGLVRVRRYESRRGKYCGYSRRAGLTFRSPKIGWHWSSRFREGVYKLPIC